MPTKKRELFMRNLIVIEKSIAFKVKQNQLCSIFKNLNTKEASRVRIDGVKVAKAYGGPPTFENACMENLG